MRVSRSLLKPRNIQHRHEGIIVPHTRSICENDGGVLSQCYMAANTTILIYDYLLTLSDEVRQGSLRMPCDFPLKSRFEDQILLV